VAGRGGAWPAEQQHRGKDRGPGHRATSCGLDRRSSGHGRSSRRGAPRTSRLAPFAPLAAPGCIACLTIYRASAASTGLRNRCQIERLPGHTAGRAAQSPTGRGRAVAGARASSPATMTSMPPSKSSASSSSPSSAASHRSAGNRSPACRSSSDRSDAGGWSCSGGTRCRGEDGPVDVVDGDVDGREHRGRRQSGLLQRGDQRLVHVHGGDRDRLRVRHDLEHQAGMGERQFPVGAGPCPYALLPDTSARTDQRPSRPPGAGRGGRSPRSPGPGGAGRRRPAWRRRR
jgi:hypothetical protein